LILAEQSENFFISKRVVLERSADHV
jgi:hypothetical protein